MYFVENKLVYAIILMRLNVNSRSTQLYKKGKTKWQEKLH